MKIWNQAPLVRLVLPFLAGILAAIYFPVNILHFFLLILPLFLFVCAIIYIPVFKIAYRESWLYGLAITCLLFAFGYQVTIFQTAGFSKDHYSRYTSTGMVHARLTKSVIEKERSVKAVLEIMDVEQNGSWRHTSGKVLVYFKKEEKALKLNYGDELILSVTFNDIKEPQNPGAFDYKRFLSFHNLYQQAYVGSGKWIDIKINSGNPILRSSYELRDKLLDVLSENNIKGEEYAVGAALLLGYSDKLEPDLISAYSSTGALHVLSVSGLHVAIVYVVFNWLLFFLDKFKHGNILKALILLLLLWFYSALTGMSPSVLRASTMFSFIIIAKALDRHTNIYNTLAASAFLLLAIDPYLIMDVGFQLSYIAVIGIVYIQPKIYHWFDFNNWLLDQMWSLTSVSIAAQIATFPLGLYYFHQFPNYFLLSNFIVIPISSIIIYVGIALFALAKITLIATYLSAVFNWFVWLLNASVKMIEHWPNALLQGISISITETILIYALIAFFFSYFTKRKVRYLKYALGIFILILISQMIEQVKEQSQHTFIVYNVPKTSVLEMISAKKSYLLSDSAFALNESALLYNVKHNWWNLGVTEFEIIKDSLHSEIVYGERNILQFKEKRIALVDLNYNKTYLNKSKIHVDYLVLSHNSKCRIEDLIVRHKPARIIFDSSNSIYSIRKWKEECVALKQNYYSVPDSGAFVVDI